jgi:hypothetical protein
MSKSDGIGLGGFIFLIFLVLKLAEIGQVAHWSWLWVTSPLWIPVGIGIGFWLCVLIFVGIVAGIAACFPKRNRFGRRIS